MQIEEIMQNKQTLIDNAFDIGYNECVGVKMYQAA